MRWLVVFLVPFFFLVGPSPSEAWGRNGHRITCELAYGLLTPEARLWVDNLQKGESEGFAESCLWADRVKRTTHPETYNYHFINMSPGEKSINVERDCARGDCIVLAIDGYVNQLRDSSLDQGLRRDALKFLAHLVGDIHQPLHCGRLEDLGGNLSHTCFFGNCGYSKNPLNLHVVWDISILNREGEPWRSMTNRLEEQLTHDPYMLESGGTILDWAQESTRLTEEYVYEKLPPWGVDETYYLGGIRIVDQRLMQGAVRLANLITELATSSPPEPSQR